jgi:hypothetical protein
MIQLANDPNASRTSHRPEHSEAKESDFSAKRARTGHAWPFLSRYAAKPAKPAKQDNQKPAASDSGS